MPDLDVSRRHPLYETWRVTTNFLWLSYNGGREYHAADDPPFLDRYPSETATEYAARRERAYLLNFFAATIDAYVAAVFRRDPVREPTEEEARPPPPAPPAPPITQGAQQPATAPVPVRPQATPIPAPPELSPGFEAFIEDATGEGSDLNKFSREVATFALAAERVFVGVDVPTGGGKPYAYLIHPNNVFDFAVDPQTGMVIWAIVGETFVDDSDPFAERMTEDRYRLWLPTEWILFDDKGNMIKRGRNAAGRVPIVQVPGYRVRLPVYDIAAITKRIYNHCSQLDEIFYQVTFPTFYFSAGEGVDDRTGDSVSAVSSVGAVPLGPRRAIEVPSATDLQVIPPGYLSPPSEPAQLLIDERTRLIDSIRSLAGLERKDPDALSPQSGVAKAYDFRETNERFVSLAQVIEEFEVELFDILGAYNVVGDINISYNKEFYVKDFQILTETYEKVQDFKLPTIVKKIAARDYSLALAEEASEEEKRAIRDAVEAMTDFDAQTNGAAPAAAQRLRGLLEMQRPQAAEQQRTPTEGGE